MDDSADRLIAQIAEAQHGYFRLEQAEGVGLSADQREARLRAGRWVVRYDRVYRMAGVPPSWRGELFAASAEAPGPAHASHRAGAALRGLPGGRVDLVEITCHRWKRARSSGLVVHESKLIGDGDVEIVDGIPTASVEQTLLGLAAVVDDTVVEQAIDRSLHLKLTTPEALHRFVQRKGKRGRNGVGVLRALLLGIDPHAGRSESVMETKLKQLLRRSNLPTPEFQYEIWHDGRFIARVDAAYPQHRIAIEYDSYEFHSGRAAIDRDSERRARLARIDWETITFTAASLRSGGGAQIEALRTKLGFGVIAPSNSRVQ
jgi:hypothetical protein